MKAFESEKDNKFSREEILQAIREKGIEFDEEEFNEYFKETLIK